LLCGLAQFCQLPLRLSGTADCIVPFDVSFAPSSLLAFNLSFQVCSQRALSFSVLPAGQIALLCGLTQFSQFPLSFSGGLACVLVLCSSLTPGRSLQFNLGFQVRNSRALDLSVLTRRVLIGYVLIGYVLIGYVLIGYVLIGYVWAFFRLFILAFSQVALLCGLAQFCQFPLGFSGGLDCCLALTVSLAPGGLLALQLRLQLRGHLPQGLGIVFYVDCRFCLNLGINLGGQICLDGLCHILRSARQLQERPIDLRARRLRLERFAHAFRDLNHSAETHIQ
jgi:hypothetical protein